MDDTCKMECLGDTCELTRADSASDEVIVSGYWFKRWKVKATGMVETTGSTSTFVTNAEARGAIRRNDDGLACGHEQTVRSIGVCSVRTGG